MLDRVRTALFDRLGNVTGSRALDLFAGTGSLGLEALSRGAASCVFVESSASALAALRANVGKIGAEGRARVVRGDAFRFVRTCGAAAFDLVFFDPPYTFLRGPRRGRTLEVLAVLRTRVLAPRGRAAFHFPRDLLAPEELTLAGPAEIRSYGSSSLAFLCAP